MKKTRYIIIIFSCFFLGNIFGQIPNPNTYGASNATSTVDEEIHEISVGTLTNNSGCVGAAPANWPAGNGLPVSVISQYSNYTNGTTPLPLPVLSPGSPIPWSVKIAYDASNTFAWNFGYSVFIDLNRNGAWDLPQEKVGGSTGTTTAPAGCTNGTANFTGTFTLPPTFSVGETLMRFVTIEGNPTPPPTGAYTWGETEDYKVFLGQRVYDLTAGKIVAPDSLRFCAEDPRTMMFQVRNVGNQLIPGGIGYLRIRGIEPGSTTLIIDSSIYGGDIKQGDTPVIIFAPTNFPKDEVVEAMFCFKSNLDTIRGNDTLRKIIQIYKRPTFRLAFDTACIGSPTKVYLDSFSKPCFKRWDNEAITDTTFYSVSATRTVGVSIERGSSVFFNRPASKCRVDTSMTIVPRPNPTVTMSRDTVLCNWQKVRIKATTSATDIAWNDTSGTKFSDTIMVGGDVTRYYTAIVKDIFGCTAKDSVKITAQFPTGLTKVNDTVCVGQEAAVGVAGSPEYFFNWIGRTETTPIIRPVPSVAGLQPFITKWTYRGCTDRDTLTLLARPNPVITLRSRQNKPICPGFFDTLEVRGGPSYKWKNGFGSDSNIYFAPTKTALYSVTSTDSFGCSTEKSITTIVNPKTFVGVFSNKYKDFICGGDSAFIFATGAKTYQWSTGSTDSILKVTPAQSLDWKVVGTDANGCRDTALFRMAVKPPFRVNPQPVRGCYGDSILMTLSGGIGYDWGINGITTDSFAKIVLDGTTGYKVLVTSPDSCQITVNVPITVAKRPLLQVRDATVCPGETASLEAFGGSKYEWENSSNTTSKESYTFSSTTTLKVVAINDEGCRDSTMATVYVIPKTNFTVKSPLPKYLCPNIPSTLVITPVGGTYFGPKVNGFVWNVDSLVAGNYSVRYVYTDPINGCKDSVVVPVEVVRDPSKCNPRSSVGNVLALNEWKIYPNPFTNRINLTINSAVREQGVINIYDIAGRKQFSASTLLTPGNNEIVLEDLLLPKGVYILELETPSYNRQEKLVRE